MRAILLLVHNHSRKTSPIGGMSPCHDTELYVGRFSLYQDGVPRNITPNTGTKIARKH